MHDINRLKIFVINLERAQDRRLAMKKQLDAFNIPFEFFPAIDGQHLTPADLALYSSAETLRIHGRDLSRNEIGCALSHLSIYQLLLNAPFDECLILEDDVRIHAALWEVLEARKNLPADWEFVNFITDAVEEPLGVPIVGIYQATRFTEWANGCCVNLVNKKGAAKLLAAAYPIRFAADGLTGITAVTNLISYGVQPRVASLEDVPSTIWTQDTTTKKIKVISFSLWGDNPIYLDGAVRNAELAASLYPGWICRFYCAANLDVNTLQQLQNKTNVEIVLMPPAPDRAGAFWRFLAAEDPTVSHVIFRDTDSRLSAREAVAVQTWLESAKPFHLMRDHPFHWPAIMAGMWGCQGGTLTGWRSVMDEVNAQPASLQAYGGDQTFLSERVYPQIKAQCLIHDAIGLSEAGLDIRPFPTLRHGLEFVGQSFDSHDQPNLYYEQELAAVAGL
jgi:GR25 family glycosyltransferase involved in LPS biosynthesis